MLGRSSNLSKLCTNTNLSLILVFVFCMSELPELGHCVSCIDLLNQFRVKIEKVRYQLDYIVAHGLTLRTPVGAEI